MNDKSVLYSLLGVTVLGLLFPIECHASFAIIGALIGGLAGLGSSLIGSSSASSEREQALQLIQQSIKDLEKIGVPSVEAQKIVLEKYRSAGQLTPELEQYFQNPDSLLQSIQVDPQLKEAQLGGLSKLQEIVDSGGATLEDKANLAAIQGDLAAKERGSREAILSNMRQRGASGSGLELAAQLQNQQGSASRANTAGLDIAAQAQKRALDALLQRSQLAGDIRGQEFGEEAKKAEAQDLINRFNTQNRQDVQQRNVAMKNQAAQTNLANDQQIMSANTGLSNQQELHNKGLIQQQYQNKMQQATAKANARANQATQHNVGADRTQATWSGIGDAFAKAGSAYDQEKKDEKYGTQAGYWGKQ